MTHTRAHMAKIGSLGQKALREKFPDQDSYRLYMKELAVLGAQALHAKYVLRPVGTSGWALVDRETDVAIRYMNMPPGYGRERESENTDGQIPF